MQGRQRQKHTERKADLDAAGPIKTPFEKAKSFRLRESEPGAETQAFRAL